MNPSKTLTPLEQCVLQTIGATINVVTLCGDPDSYLEMEQAAVHVSSAKFGTHYFRVTLTETTADEYFKPSPP